MNTLTLEWWSANEDDAEMQCFRCGREIEEGSPVAAVSIPNAWGEGHDGVATHHADCAVANTLKMQSR